MLLNKDEDVLSDSLYRIGENVLIFLIFMYELSGKDEDVFIKIS